jgi:hypothetical protein
MKGNDFTARYTCAVLRRVTDREFHGEQISTALSLTAKFIGDPPDTFPQHVGETNNFQADFPQLSDLPGKVAIVLSRWYWISRTVEI